MSKSADLMKPQQVSVPLPPSLREYVQRQAERQERSVAAVIRRLVADAAKREARQAEGRAA